MCGRAQGRDGAEGMHVQGLRVYKYPPRQEVLSPPLRVRPEQVVGLSVETVAVEGALGLAAKSAAVVAQALDRPHPLLAERLQARTLGQLSPSTNVVVEPVESIKAS